MYDYDSNNYVLLLESVKLPSDVKRRYSTNVKLTNTGGGEVLPGILGGGVPPGFPNPDPISNPQKMLFFKPVFRPGL